MFLPDGHNPRTLANVAYHHARGDAILLNFHSCQSIQCTKFVMFLFRAVRHAPGRTAARHNQRLPQSQTLTDVRDDGSTRRQ
jgi:hypothetical protein